LPSCCSATPGSLVSIIIFSAAGRTLAFGSEDGTLGLWDTRTHRQRQLGAPLKGRTDAVKSLAVSADGRRLASISREGTVRLWHAATGKQRQVGAPLKGDTGAVKSVAFSVDGGTLASTSEDETVRFWDTRTRKQLGAPQASYPVRASAALSPDGRPVASINFDGTTRAEKVLWRKVATLGLRDDR
jgi:WD40 repeat protein